MTVEEIRAHHAVPPNLPPGSLGLLGPCRCPVCDPAFHAEQTEKPPRQALVD